MAMMTAVFVVAAFALLLGAVPAGPAMQAYADHDMQDFDGLSVVFIGLGSRGDSTLVILPNDKTVLIDGGLARSYPNIQETLQYFGVDTIDTMIASHADQDHIDGLNSLLEDDSVTVGQVLISPVEKGTKVYQEFLALADGETVAYAGQSIDHDESVKITVLSPPESEIRSGSNASSSNSNSIITLLEYGEMKFLFTADATRTTEQWLIENYPASVLDVDIMNGPHHGSKHASTAEFIAATSPQLVVFSADRDNQYGHPDPETIQRYESAGITNLYTTYDRNITVQTDGTSCSLVLEDVPEDEKPCFEGVDAVSSSVTVTPPPSYSAARADTVDSITVTADGPLTGIPEAAGFEVMLGAAGPYFALATPPVLSGNGTVITLVLPAGQAISSGDAIKVRYTRDAGSASDLATFQASGVTNNVHAAPGGLDVSTTTPASVADAPSATLSWNAVAAAPADGAYVVQYRQQDSHWGLPVDKGLGTTHTFGGLSQSTQYEFRVYLADVNGNRISDYGIISASTNSNRPPAPTVTTVAGNVFHDANRDQLFNGGESGMPGIAVLVYDYIAGARNDRQTNPDGGYEVTGIQPNQTALAQIVLPVPSGYLPSGGIYSLFEYTPYLDGSDVIINFPLYYVPPEERGIISFDVYHDQDNSGTRDAGEPGVPGATVFTFELLTYAADVQATDQAGSTIHRNLIPDVVLAQISAVDPATGSLLLPDGFTRITTSNGGAEYVTVEPGGTTTISIGLGR